MMEQTYYFTARRNRLINGIEQAITREALSLAIVGPGIDPAELQRRLRTMAKFQELAGLVKDANISDSLDILFKLCDGTLSPELVHSVLETYEAIRPSLNSQSQPEVAQS
jgi:hypothetical protein